MHAEVEPFSFGLL